MTTGNHLEPVDKSLYVFRLARPSKDFEEKKSIFPITFTAFAMSTEDKKGTPPHLSVWVENYTTPNQAYNFLQPDSPNKTICWLNVDDVHNVCSEINQQIYRDLLDVLWVNITISQIGSEGHAGIVGLDQQNKLLRKDLRSKLADKQTTILLIPLVFI